MPTTSPYPGPPLFGPDDGYDADGFNADGYDRDGYDRTGVSTAGYDRDGNPKNVPADELNLPALWAVYGRTHFFRRQSYLFLQYLREITRDPEYIDDVGFCCTCGVPGWNDDMAEARGNSDTLVCTSCSDSWSSCDHCSAMYPAEELTQTLDSATVCDTCRDDLYTMCDYCDGYYEDGEAEMHQHDQHNQDNSDSCCTSPQQKFTIRNDGCEPLANDTRIVIEMPAGVIDVEGISAIGACLRQEYSITGNEELYSLSLDLGQLEPEWQTRTGNFAKRLSSFAYKKYKTKISTDLLSQIGCIARDHSTSVSTVIEITRDLNQSAGYFYHEDSCWWGGYSSSRCTLKTNGGFALRAFNAEGYVSGRAWIMPLRRNEREILAPTFNTVTPDAFVVFNGYGDLSGYSAPRIIAHMAGWTYRKIGFSCEPMYINAGGYIVAPEDTARQYTDRSLSLYVATHSSLFSTEQVNARKEAANVRS